MCKTMSSISVPSFSSLSQVVPEKNVPKYEKMQLTENDKNKFNSVLGCRLGCQDLHFPQTHLLTSFFLGLFAVYTSFGIPVLTFLLFLSFGHKTFSSL